MRNPSGTEGYLSSLWHQLIADIPKAIGVIVILIIGYFISKVVAAIIRKALNAAHLNQHLHTGQGGNLVQRAIPDPSGLIAQVVFWLLFLLTISLAASEIGIPAIEQIVHGIYAYIPNVIAALLIFLVAGAVSGLVATLVTNTMGNTPTGKILATAAPVVVMGIAIFMILTQLRIAPAIVTITYAGLVATATLAFGLGGKDAASRMFMGMYETAQRNKDTAARDLRQGAANARDKAQDLRRRAR